MSNRFHLVPRCTAGIGLPAKPLITQKLPFPSKFNPWSGLPSHAQYNSNLIRSRQSNGPGLMLPLLRNNTVIPGAKIHWRRRCLGHQAYWLCQLAGWGGLVVCLTAGGIANDPGLYRRIWMLDWLSLGAAGVVASHFLRSMILSARERPSGWQLAIWLLPRLTAALAAMWGLRAFFVVVLEPPPFNNPQLANPVYGLETLVIMCTWAGFYFAHDYYRRYETGVMERLRLDTALKEAELRALKAQINPHFLFNSLNTLRALIPHDLNRPREAVTLLADLLRASLTAGEQETVFFARELEIIESYLALQQLRFEGRLIVRLNVTQDARPWPVPPFLLQGLVENAVKFGIAAREAGGEISLAVEIRDQAFHAVITNPGRLNTESSSTGLGLANARERLRMLFGPAAQLTLRQQAPDLVAAEVQIPAQNRGNPS